MLTLVMTMLTERIITHYTPLCKVVRQRASPFEILILSVRILPFPSKYNRRAIIFTAIVRLLLSYRIPLFYFPI